MPVDFCFKGFSSRSYILPLLEIDDYFGCPLFAADEQRRKREEKQALKKKELEEKRAAKKAGLGAMKLGGKKLATD